MKNKTRTPKYKNYRTARLVMRPLRLSDYRTWVRASETALPKQDKFDLGPIPLPERTEKKFRNAVLRNQTEAKKDLCYRWNIFLKTTGETIGWMDVSTIQRRPLNVANFGYFILNRHRKNGYAAEAAKVIVRAGLRDLKFQRLEAVIDLDNRRSIRLVRRIGLYREGIRKHYWYQNGRWEDQVVFIATPELFKR